MPQTRISHPGYIVTLDLEGSLESVAELQVAKVH